MANIDLFGINNKYYYMVYSIILIAYLKLKHIFIKTNYIFIVNELLGAWIPILRAI